MYWNDVTQSFDAIDASQPEATELATNPEDPKPESRHRRLLRFVQELLGAGTRGVLLALLLIYFVAQAHVVYGQSMEPTLHTNQRLIVEKISYRLAPPERGDIVIIEPRDGEERLIKRVVGLAGETVEIRNNQLYINERPFSEPYLSLPTSQANFGPVVVPPHHVFVLGDNRNNSNDSRYFGAVDLSKITGRAWVSYWPFADLGVVH